MSEPASSEPAASEQSAWADFLAWLREAANLEDPAEVFAGYRRALASRGVADPAARFEIVLRLMRERADAWPLMFDRIYGSGRPRVTPAPNALLMQAIAGRPPGRALDVAMGQGRNAVALAAAGWDVAGFDVSAEGLAVAAAGAAHAGVTIRTSVDTCDRFAYGERAWDLIAVIYGPGAVAQPAFAARLRQALRPGGIVVVESFASPAGSAQRRPVDIDPADLLRAFADWRLRRFEDTDGVTDWTPQTTSLVRLVAERRD